MRLFPSETARVESCGNSLLCRVIVTVFFLVAVCGARPQNTADSDSLAVNDALKDAYSSIRTVPASAIPSKALTDTLVQQLQKLDNLDVEMRELAIGNAYERQLYAEANQNRALAWLHAWALFSKVAIAVDSPSLDRDLRDRLFTLHAADPTSALGLLLKTYSQLRAAATTLEPLQEFLADDSNFSYELEYRQSWRNRRPATIHHDYYIPAGRDIIGTPSDDAALNDDQLLSLWGLVNAQLDNWQVIVSSTSKTSSSVVLANSIQLTPLANWLNDVANDTYLDAFSQAPGTSLTDLKARVHKLSAFVDFRERCADQGRLENLVERLAGLRSQQNSDPRQLLSTLVDAATPLPDSQDDVSFDAAIWLRYLMFLSYKDHAEAGLGDIPGLLTQLWTAYKLPGKFLLTPSGSKVARSGFIRWGMWPTPGSFDSVLGDATDTLYQYLVFRDTILGQEATKLLTSDAASRSAYARVITQNVQSFRLAIKSIAPYFGSYNPSLPSSAEPNALSDSTNPLSRAFRYSSSEREQARLLDDLSALWLQSNTDVSLEESVAKAYAYQDARNIALAVHSLGGITPLSDWNAYDLPQKTFDQYRADLLHAVDLLHNQLSKQAAEKDLRFTFRERQLSYNAAVNSLAASRLGSQVATRALAISETFKTIAQLDVEISDVEKHISDLDLKGAKSKEQADALRLSYATQIRDLAAAKVEALTVASRQAESMIEDAVQQVNEQRKQLLATAQQISDQKARSHAFGLIDAIITVVGAALAPFTGGSSLMIATQVEQVIAIVNKVSQTDWSKFPQAVATVQQIGNQIQSAGQLAISLGASFPQNILSDYKQYLTSAEAAVSAYAQPLEKLNLAIQSLNDQNKIGEVASAIASGLPVSIDTSNNTLRVKFGDKQLILGNQALQASLTDVVKAGGMFVNDVKLRSQAAATLPLLEGSELRAELKKAVDALVQPLPNQLVVAPPVEGVTAALTRAKQGLESAIDALPEADAKALAQALATGMLFVRDSVNNQIVAVQAETNAEREKFKGRLEKYKQQIASGLLTNAASAINQITADIGTKAQTFVDNQDDQGLSHYAGDPNGELSGKIDQLQQQLTAIKQQIDSAQGELEDKTTEATIAQYDNEASRYFSQAAELHTNEAELRSRKAALIQDAAVAEIEKAKILKDATADEEAAREQAVEVASLSLRQTYFACLAQGFNPITPGSNAVTEVSETPTLHALIYGSNDPVKRAGFGKIADSISGMLKWLNLLHISDNQGNKTVLDWYLEFIRDMQTNDIAKLEDLGQRLEGAFATQMDVSIVTVRNDTSRNISGPALTWIDTLPSELKNEWSAKLPSQWRDRAIASFRFTVSLDPNAEQPAAVLIYGTPYSYYALLDNLAVTTEPTAGNIPTNLGYYFFVIPPETPVSSPSDVTSGLSNHARQQLSVPAPVSASLAEVAETRQLQNEILGNWKQLDLSGALGTWTFYLLAHPAPTAAELQQLHKVILHIYMPYISVKH